MRTKILEVLEYFIIFKLVFLPFKNSDLNLLMHFQKLSQRLFKRIFVLILIAINCSCSSLYYYPLKEEFAIREKMPVKPVDIYFKSKNGNILHGWYFQHRSPLEKKLGFKSDSSLGTVLFFHGNAQNLTTHFLHLYFVLDYNLDYFIFDYQGYGKSQGKPSPKNTIEDGLAAIEWVKSQNKNKPILIVGQSLGGAIALKTIIEFQKNNDSFIHNSNSNTSASPNLNLNLNLNSSANKATRTDDSSRLDLPLKPLFPLVTIDSSFSDYKKVSQKSVSKSWWTWWLQPVAWLIMDNSQSPEKDLGSIKNTEFLVIHGTKDRVVDFELGEDLFHLLPSPKKFRQVEDGIHTDYFWRDNGKNQQEWLELVKTSLSQ